MQHSTHFLLFHSPALGIVCESHLQPTRCAPPPWSRVEGKSQVNLPHMSPLRDGISVGADSRNHPFAPGLPLASRHQPSTSPQRGGKSSFSIALMRTSSRRIPASASTDQAPKKGDVILLGGLVVPKSSALAAASFSQVSPAPWRQPRGKFMVSLVNSHTNATRIGWRLWEIDLRFAPGLPPGWLRILQTGCHGAIDTTQGPSWGYLKDNSLETLSIFGDKCP